MYKRKRTLIFAATMFLVLWVASMLPVWGSPDAFGYDYVNNTSNVDGVTDIGTHSNFTAQQYGPDSTYDTLTEQNRGGEITKVGTDTSQTGNSLTLSFSHTLVSGTARIVIVSIGIENGNTIDVTTVTYGGVTMTPAVEGITGTSGFRYLAEIWYILEEDLPSDGAKTVATTCTGTASSLEINAFCAEYTGVSQGAPEATAEHHQTTGTTITNAISPSDNAWVISVVGSGNAGSFTHGQGQSEALDFRDSSSTFAVAELRGASGETSLSSTFSAGVNRLERVAASWGAINFELDLEVQWTNATYDLPNEELCIFGGTMATETIRVDAWIGSSWQNLFTDLSSGWNNVTITDYLVSSTFTIRFDGGIETGDTSQDSWEIDCTLLHTWGAAPSANFFYTPQYPYTGETASFNASGSYDPDGTIVSYFWDFGDGSNATGVVATHAYIDDGNYTITLTVTDNDDHSAAAFLDITVLNRPPVASFTESAETVLTSEAIHFNSSASYDPDGIIASYIWDFGDGTNATGITAEHEYADDGTYTVTLTVTDDDEATHIVTSTKTVQNRSPVSSFTESTETAYTGEAITFNASDSYDPDGVIVSYFWDFGDGTNATGVTTSHAYADDGNYLVTLTVTDDDGASDSATAMKSIMNRSPVASFTESAETAYIGEPITFNASGSYDPDGTIVSYFWDFGDGSNASGIVVNHAYATNGNYTVMLTVSDDDGAADSANATKAIFVNEPPVASFTESAETVFTAESITFNASGSYDPDGTIVSYFWDFGDGSNATGVVATHAYTDNGTYFVTLTVTDDRGATDSTSTVKTVLNRSPFANFTESADTVYTEEPITFNASGSYDPDGVIVSFFWDFGDGSNASGIVVEHAFGENGAFTVTLTATDDDGATDSTTSTKTILNRAPVASFTESAETMNTSEAITFDSINSYDPDGVIVSYFWDFGDGTNATGIAVEHGYADDGTFTVTLTVTDDDGATGTAIATKNILNRAPVAAFTESAETVSTGVIIMFNASASYDPDGSVTSYFWDFGDGTNASGVIVNHAYVDDGSYIVALTATDDDGAAAFTSATKFVLNRDPVALFTESAESVVVGEVIYFNASGSYDPDGTIVSYFWDFGDGSNATGVIAEHAYGDDGVYLANLTVIDDDGATASTLATKTVGVTPPVASFTESAETVYTGETITFNASASYDVDGVIVGYLWDFGDGTNATSMIVVHSFFEDGNYTVTLTVTDDDGVTDTSMSTKTILNRPPVASFTESGETAYVGQPITFNASDSYDPDGFIISHFWDFGDGSNATGVIAEHAYSVNGSFTVTLTAVDNDGSSSSTQSTKTLLAAATHDIAVVNVSSSAPAVYKGRILNVTVTAINNGTIPETFNITLYCSRVHGWHLVDIDGRLAWYSDLSSSANALLLTSVSIPSGDTTLVFDTKFDIEPFWDYGFVQISVDEGLTWMSLENAYTTYNHAAGADQDIVSNLPGITGANPSWPDWVTVAFNLTDYAGETVLLGFHYMTDLSTVGEGWYVDNVRVNDSPISNQAFVQASPPPIDAIQTMTVTNLAPSDQTTLVFNINTTGILSGRYALSATASTLEGEVDVSDNTYVGGVVEVKGNPDLTGDGRVDIYDIVAVAGAYGCSEGEACWNPKADLVEDGLINIHDVVAVASHYGESI